MRGDSQWEDGGENNVFFIEVCQIKESNRSLYPLYLNDGYFLMSCNFSVFFILFYGVIFNQLMQTKLKYNIKVNY